MHVKIGINYELVYETRPLLPIEITILQECTWSFEGPPAISLLTIIATFSGSFILIVAFSNDFI